MRILSAAVLAAFGLVSTVALAATVDAIYNSATDVPVAASGYTATGNTVNFTLNFAPATGTDLMVVQNTGLDFINGTFDNLANGQGVALRYAGTTYNFVATYYGGSGNDLVLVWANQRAFAWGWNGWGGLGDNTTTQRQAPVPVMATGVLAGKTVVAMAAGVSYCLAVCSDGTVAAWGSNGYGQLGDDTTTNRVAPVAVNMGPGSALFGKTVLAVAAGYAHSVALCSDGTAATWGRNDYGQLGDNTTTNRLLPVAVNIAPGSALFGKKVAGIAAGIFHSLALCSDGTITAWGANGGGQLGDNTETQRLVPVTVNAAPGDSALYDKKVVAIAGGAYHSLALCQDGTIAAWGWNGGGQLGDNTTAQRLMAVAVDTNSGVSTLFGKKVVAITAGDSHSLALCSDGTVAGWGLNGYGQLGDNTTTNRLAPVAVDTNPESSALFGKTVVAIKAGESHILALCSDGTVAAWGGNEYGQLGDSTTTNRSAPVGVNTTALVAGQRFSHLTSGPSAYHTLGLVAAPPASAITLAGAQTLADGSFLFAFTNTPGAFFGVLATTKPAMPLSNWTTLGDAAEVSPGQFQFTDPQGMNIPQRFYRVRSP